VGVQYRDHNKFKFEFEYSLTIAGN
jgi:hypothetical protein